VDLPPEARRIEVIEIKVATDAMPGVRIVGFDVTRDGKRLGQMFDCIVNVNPKRVSKFCTQSEPSEDTRKGTIDGRAGACTLVSGYNIKRRSTTQYEGIACTAQAGICVNDTSYSAGAQGFVTTKWTVILEAANSDSDGSVSAFARLYQDYWPPLYGYVRRRGLSPEAAEDATQDFFVSLVEKLRLSG
jgi:hypothetical protein